MDDYPSFGSDASKQFEELSIEALAMDLAEAISKKYQIGSDEASDHILARFQRNVALVTALDAAGTETLERFKRRTAYRDAAKRAQKEIYNELRTYRRRREEALAATSLLEDVAARSAADDTSPLVAEILRTHVSTAERLPHLPQFWNELASVIGLVESVIDVGCGVLPLAFPYDDPRFGAGPVWAVDRDAEAVRALTAYARLRKDNRLHAVRWDVAAGWDDLHSRGLPKKSDVALLLKIVPLLYRHQRQYLPILASAPAERLVVTGSRTSMAKLESIERRERRVLTTFFNNHGLTVLEEFITPDELGYVVARR